MRRNEETRSVWSNIESEFLLGYNHRMNKRAKKRLVEAIKKDKLERSNPAQKPMPTSRKDLKHQTGFLPRPDKKRG